MVLKEENTIVPNEKLVVKRQRSGMIPWFRFLEAEEPWEIEVVKKELFLSRIRYFG